jgi:two-component system, NtrC family, sensor kinase
VRSPLRTISGRVVLGFFVALATFGSVLAYTLSKMSGLGRDLRYSTAYFDVSLRAAQLQRDQQGAVDYLDSPTLQKPFVQKYFSLRRELLEKSAEGLDGIDDVPEEQARTIAAINDRRRALLDQLAKNAALYEEMLAASPVDAPQILQRLREKEKRLLQQIRLWFNDLRMGARQATELVERAERQARLGALILGALAAVVGLLITLWGLLTLQPLRRLADGVRLFAGGDYRQRVQVAGGTEVGELAREFNAMAQAVEERERELVRSERLAAVGKMAAVITHEVRNPLSSIGLNTELLEEELDGQDEAIALCKAIHKEVDRLTAITEEYLRFARLPRPKLERERVNTIVTGLLEFQREDLALRGVTVELSLGEDLPDVWADESQLRQALLNLVRNAADAMPAGGALAVTTRRVDTGLEVIVTDSGPGIATDVLPRIFEPFFSTKEGGTGLGLALTQQIIHEHGGRIAVDSGPGRGTTFVVRLPGEPPRGVAAA